MKVRSGFFAALLIMLSLVVVGQHHQEMLSGMALNDAGQPLPSATVRLINVNDTTKYISVLANDNGRFRFEKVEPGNYLLRITAVGYNEFKKMVVISDTQLDLGNLELQKLGKTLKEVTVTASKPLIEQRLGMSVYNVSADPMSLGKSLADIATNLPGVSQNAAGALTIDGESQVVVMVNGRKSNVNASELLRQISPANVERLELITGADPRYVSITGAAVLNIVLKKNKQNGTNGNASLMASSLGSVNIAFNINRYRGKSNVYLFLSSDDKFNQNQLNYTRQLTTTGDLFFATDTKSKIHHSLRNLTAGVDLYIDSFNVVTLENSTNFHKDVLRSSTFQTIAGTPQPTEISTAIYSSPSEFENTSSVNYRKNYKNNNKFFESEIAFTIFDLENPRLFQKSNYSEILDLSNMGLRVKSEYTTPLKNKHLVSVGASYTWIEINNRNTQVTDGVPASEIATIDYVNNKAAVYGTYFFKLKKRWSFRPGFRLERSYADTKIDHAPATKFDFTTLYPTLNILWESGKKGAFAFDFIRRITYPDLFEFYTPLNQPDTFNINSGNPLLTPSIRYNATIEYRYKAKSTNWIFRGYTRITKNMIRPVSMYTPDNKMITANTNIGTLYAYGGSVSVAIDATAKWKIRFNANANLSNVNLYNNIYAKNTNLYDFSGSLINRYIFNKRSEGEVAFRMMNYYRGINDHAVRPMYNLSFQYNYKINTKWSLAVSGNDILLTMKNYFINYPEPFIMHTQQMRHSSRYIQFTIRNNFGKVNKKRTKGLEEERLQFSNG